MRAIDDACLAYAANPMMGTARLDLGDRIRIFSYGTPANPHGWVIVYRPHDDGIEVVRIFRGGQDYSNLF